MVRQRVHGALWTRDLPVFDIFCCANRKNRNRNTFSRCSVVHICTLLIVYSPNSQTNKQLILSKLCCIAFVSLSVELASPDMLLLATAGVATQF